VYRLSSAIPSTLDSRIVSYGNDRRSARSRNRLHDLIASIQGRYSAASGCQRRHTACAHANINPLTSIVAIWAQLQGIKHPVSDRVKPSFVIFDIRAL